MLAGTVSFLRGLEMSFGTSRGTIYLARTSFRPKKVLNQHEQNKFTKLKGNHIFFGIILQKSLLGQVLGERLGDKVSA